MSFNVFCSSFAKILRIDADLYSRIMENHGKSFSVESIYRRGFDIVGEDGYLLHFCNAEVLTSPFTACLDRSVIQFIPELTKGEVFLLKDNCFYRKLSNTFNILLGSCAIINLKKKYQSFLLRKMK
jgi:hypothetical protein